MITDVFTQREAQNGGTGHGERHGERHGEKGSERLQAQRLFLLCFQLHSLRGVMLLCKAEPSSVVGANGAERLHVGLASAHGATHFTCITCDQEYTKGGAFKHFTRKKHGLDPDVVKRWAVCTDGTALRNKRPQKMKLETALGRKQDLGEPTEVLDSDEEVRAVAEMLPIPRSWSRPAPSSASELGRNIRRRLRGKGPCDSIVV